MPITPRKTVPTANTVIIPHLEVGMIVEADGTGKGAIYDLTMQQAAVDGLGKFTPIGVQGRLGSTLTFGFDNEGNITGLPDDLVSIGPKLAAAWAAIVEVGDAVNAIREIA